MGTVGNAAGTVKAIAWMSRSRLLLIVVALGLIGFGLYTGSRPPTCRGRDMAPGDVCVEGRGPSSATTTYDDLRSDDAAVRTMGVGIGAILLLCAGARQLQVVAQRRRAAEPTPPQLPRPVVPPAPFGGHRSPAEPGSAPYRPFGGGGAPPS